MLGQSIFILFKSERFSISSLQIQMDKIRIQIVMICFDSVAGRDRRWNGMFSELFFAAGHIIYLLVLGSERFLRGQK